jgi:hypothetical protein
MIPWVHEACEEWAQQVRRREGMLPLSDLTTYDYVHSSAGLSDRGHEVGQAAFRMRATPAMLVAHQALVAHYLFPGTPKAKIRVIECTKDQYWDALHEAHCYLAARIDYPMLATG